MIRTSVLEGVGTLTLERPEARNALSVEMCDAIVDGLSELDQDAVRVVVIGGSGKTFCSGADFAAVSGPNGTGFLQAFERMLEVVASYRLPTIARIQGAALGGGLQLATVCDFRIAGASARLGIPSARLGIVINFENVERLVLLAGMAVAKEVLMTARTFTADEAREAGLVTRVEADEDLDESVREMARSIAALAPLSVQGAKRAIRVVGTELSSARRGSPAEVAVLDELVAEAYASSDLSEGLAAMVDKRPPRFEGR